ncbi:hypothetical protein ABKN59_009155 [Abortiporus biennis]
MSTSPPSSSSSSASSPSSSSVEDILKKEFDSMLNDDNVNASDTLDFLLQNINAEFDTSSSSSSSHPSSPPDWSQLSAWTNDAKLFDPTTDIDFTIGMDMDFDPHVTVDPSSLHFNTSIFTQQDTVAVTPETPFVLSPNPNTAQALVSASIFHLDNQSTPVPWASSVFSNTGTRRLSVTSSSSSSGASLSPVCDSSASSDSGHSETDAAMELAHKVRQASGVTLAVPVSAQVQQIAAAGGQAKLPIPRLPRPNVAVPAKRTVVKSPSSPEGSLSPSPTPSLEKVDPLGQNASAAGSTAPTTTGRPKTSHTTIERRYRTNLNARIIGLKQSVPALRVLEPKLSAELGYEDVVDSRGFVDGVKVARKMSKANILGKATEYIRVLKKRESRLRREQDGLKSLLSGLVGGPALLKEWEREWRDRFGGSEKDEIEDEGGSDDEEEDSDGDEDEGRARKKAKVTKVIKKEKPAPKPLSAPPPVMPMASGIVPEKRKRGRPRKNPVPSAPPSSTPTPLMMAEQPVMMQQDVTMQEPIAHAQPAQQYLLAAFAFFSVFNSPLTNNYSRSHSAPHSHAHHGTVITEPSAYMPPPPRTFYGYGAHEIIQAFHLLVSTLVFFYVVLPWISGVLKHGSVITKAITRFASYFTHSRKQHPYLDPRQSLTLKRSALTDALIPSKRGLVDEASQLRNALGVSSGVVGLMQGVIKAARIDRGIELNQLEQRAWVRLGEIVAFDNTVPKATRLQTYWCMSWHISTFAASTTDLSTLALIIQPVSSAKAASLWDRARKQELLRPYERIVLSNMTVDDAAEWLAKWRLWHETERKGRCAACEKRTPLGVLAAILIRERLRKHAAAMFVRTVPGEDGNDALVYDADKEFQEEQERKETIEAGKSIGGRTAELAILLERIWDTGFVSHEDVLPAPRQLGTNKNPDEDVDCEDEHDLASTDEAEIRSLLSATVMYRRIFPSSFPACGSSSSVSLILSPPPSPSRRNLALHSQLRIALGTPVDHTTGRLCDEKLGAALEEARDRVEVGIFVLELNKL